MSSAPLSWRAARAGTPLPHPGDRPRDAAGASARLRMRGHIKVGRWLPFRTPQSAAGRAGAEAIWLPTTLLPRLGAPVVR